MSISCFKDLNFFFLISKRSFFFSDFVFFFLVLNSGYLLVLLLLLLLFSFIHAVFLSSLLYFSISFSLLSSSLQFSCSRFSCNVPLSHALLPCTPFTPRSTPFSPPGQSGYRDCKLLSAQSLFGLCLLLLSTWNNADMPVMSTLIDLNPFFTRHHRRRRHHHRRCVL